MRYEPINLREKFAKFSDQWAPKIVAQMNDYHLKLVKIQGDFAWHRHDDTDEVFLVLKGAMAIHFSDGVVKLTSGEMFVVPKGVLHTTSADDECKIMLVERAGTVNTGDARSDRTAADGVWI